MRSARGCEVYGRGAGWARVRVGGPLGGVQAQSGPHVVGVAGLGRAGLGGARQAAGREAGAKAGSGAEA